MQLAACCVTIRQLSMLQASDLRLWNHTDKLEVHLTPVPILAMASMLQRQHLQMRGLPPSMVQRYRNVALPLIAAGITELQGNCHCKRHTCAVSNGLEVSASIWQLTSPALSRELSQP